MTDTTYDPDLLLDMVKHSTPPYTLHLSWSCLAASQLGVSVILLLLYCTATFSWYITEMELLVISKPGQIAFVDSTDCHCNGHLCSTLQRCSTPTDDEFDFCPFSSLQGWSLKVNFEIPHKTLKDLLLPSVYLEYIEWTWRPLCMHGQLLFVAKTVLLCHLFTK